MPTPKCGICDDDFSSEDGDHSPRNLKCCHTLCEGCIKKLLNNCRIVCPFCREPTEVLGSNIKSLHKNFSLIEIIQLMGNTTEVTTEKTSDNFPPKCEEHPYNLAEFVCIESDCSSKNKLMCRTCEEFGAHEGHKKGLLKTKAAELRKQLECWLKQIRINIQLCTKNKNGKEEEVANNEKLLNTKLKEIKNHFDAIRQSVNEKEKKIINETTAEAIRIRESNNSSITYLIGLRVSFAKDIEDIEQRKYMNDKQLYTTGIDLAGKWTCWSKDLSERSPIDTKGMDVKLPDFNFGDGN